MKPFETSLIRIAELATARRDDFEILRYTLEFADDLSDADLDALVDEVAAPIIAAIDCKQCANCCRALDVYLMPEDADRLAEGLNRPAADVIAEYVDRDSAADVEEWGKIRARPCPFLKGKLCSIYAHRPDSCRLYPVFTPDFRWTLDDLIPGAALCPIIYHVLDTLAERFDCRSTSKIGL